MIKINGELISLITYPSGEKGLNNPFSNKDIYYSIEVNFDSNYFEDIFWLNLLFTEYLEKNKSFNNLKVSFNLLPLAREDREEEGRLFTFKRIYEMLFLDQIDFEVTDIHSNKLIPFSNKTIFNEFKSIYEFFDLKKDDLIVFPDKGAYEKYHKVALEIDQAPNNYIILNKKRNSQTGKIEGIEIKESHNQDFNDNQKALIIDDLCSYGGTFKGAAKVIPNKIVYLFTVYDEELVDSLDGIERKLSLVSHNLRNPKIERDVNFD